MGFMDIFYPDPRKKLMPKYRKHCGCQDCIKRQHSYGELWRHKTPVCSCCDCMSEAGLNIPHNHSTYGHRHAATHTCANPQCHSSSSSCCGPPMHPMHPVVEPPPPKYSLMPQTTHKVDEFCPSRHYTTPLSLAKPHTHGCNCAAGRSGYHNGCPPTAVAPGYHPQMYLSMPGDYRPCNR
ncbi:hypothetical protein GGI07_005388 [Coemansia sp. Benny D115]|nr:hypothetical protein GGI07_005388 [Coemansia sp. Benny D115]